MLFCATRIESEKRHTSVLVSKYQLLGLAIHIRMNEIFMLDRNWVDWVQCRKICPTLDLRNTYQHGRLKSVAPDVRIACRKI